VRVKKREQKGIKGKRREISRKDRHELLEVRCAKKFEIFGKELKNLLRLQWTTNKGTVC
jgi:hypothetical protein